MLLISISLLISAYNLDQTLADYFYRLQGGAWSWKNSWLAENFFHKGGRNLSLLLAFICLLLLVATYIETSQQHHRRHLLYLLFAVAGGSLLISIAKASLSISCPWEFARYGGSLEYHPVAEQIFLRNGAGCFPAGQASAGYAWIALYFLGGSYNSPWRWPGLVGALLAGLVLGGAQQIRGAHFISHDIWTLAICWFFSLALYLLMFKKS